MDQICHCAAPGSSSESKWHGREVCWADSGCGGSLHRALTITEEAT